MYRYAPVIPYYDWNDFTLFGVTFHTFGLLVALSVVLGHRMVVKRGLALGLADVKTLDTFSLVVLASGFVSAHVLDAVWYHPEVVREHPVELLMLHHGLSSFGGLVGAVTGGLLWLRWKRFNAWAWADLCTYAFPFGWLLGRAGCAIAHDHKGMLTDSPLAVRFPDGPRLDLGLIELALTPLVVAAVVITSRKTKRPGMISAVYAMTYPLIRFPLDFLRARDLGPDSDPRYAGLTPAQWMCMGSVALGFWIFFRARQNPPLEPPARPQPASASTSGDDAGDDASAGATS